MMKNFNVLVIRSFLLRERKYSSIIKKKVTKKKQQIIAKRRVVHRSLQVAIN